MAEDQSKLTFHCFGMEKVPSIASRYRFVYKSTKRKPSIVHFCRIWLTIWRDLEVLVSHLSSTCQPVDQHLSASWSPPVSHWISTCQPLDKQLSAAWSAPISCYLFLLLGLLTMDVPSFCPLPPQLSATPAPPKPSRGSSPCSPCSPWGSLRLPLTWWYAGHDGKT